MGVIDPYEVPEREWDPDDVGPLPPVPESCYPPGSVPLAVELDEVAT